MSVCASQITALSWHCPGSYWTMNMFTLVQTSELLFQSQTHFGRVVVELTGRYWRSLAEIHRGRASGQEVDAMRTHQPAQTSAVVVMQRPRRLHSTGTKEKFQSATARRFFQSFLHTGARTHAHTTTACAAHEYSGCKLLQLLFCSWEKFFPPPPPNQSYPESANLTFHMIKQSHPDALEQGRGFYLGEGQK